MPWTDLDGRSVVLADLLTPTVQYERDGADLSRRGLNLERNAGKDQLLASGRLDGGRDFRIVPRVDRGAIDDVLSSHHFHEFGEGRPPHAVAGRGGDNGWDPQHLGGLGQGDNIMFEFA